jgi:ribosomal protein L32
VYISVSAVTAAYGFALTATHFSKRRSAGQQKVSKRLCPGVRPAEGAKDQKPKQKQKRGGLPAGLFVWFVRISL